MLVVVAAHRLAEVSVGDQALLLHVLEDHAPPLAAELHRRDVVARQRFGRAGSGGERLGLEDRSGDLLDAGRELVEGPALDPAGRAVCPSASASRNMASTKNPTSTATPIHARLMADSYFA